MSREADKWQGWAIGGWVVVGMLLLARWNSCSHEQQERELWELTVEECVDLYGWDECRELPLVYWANPLYERPERLDPLDGV